MPISYRAVSAMAETNDPSALKPALRIQWYIQQLAAAIQMLPGRFLAASALAFALGACLWYLPVGISADARVSLVAFAAAVVFWVVSRLDKTFIALAALCAGAVVGTSSFDTTVLGALGHGMIGLLLAAFVIAKAITLSGLAQRITAPLVRNSRSVARTFYALTGAMLVLAMVMPSTSGRAALMLPVFLTIAGQVANPRVTRALALLIPTVILLSSAGSLIGAGANILAADAIWRLTGERIDYLRWMTLGLPFAVVSCFLSTWVILTLFLGKAERERPLVSSGDQPQPTPATQRLTAREKFVLSISASLVVLWCTQSLHGIDNVTVALVGALAVTAPGLGVLTFKQAVQSIDWNLLLFMAACLQLGDALIGSGGAGWAVDSLFRAMPLGGADTAALLAMVATVCLLAHLVVTSRMARASILVPMILPIAISLGYNPAAFAIITAIATGYCLTLPVSAKPLAMMSELDGPTFKPGDLLALSAVLLPLHLGLLVIFSLYVWPWLGLPLSG
ncbi:SLC13 family permease [Pelagibius litoralis]|uniref:SLC13 family permease n=1 Tax=Pelagibius litoralis TaxID=374515 RepID=A0A967EVH1_9PROT|nr:SLC13 family permease [Pelagibius litoralis]NIA68661.1 SLC13 family permease [Pelagibius litoralis]